MEIVSIAFPQEIAEDTVKIITDNFNCKFCSAREKCKEEFGEGRGYCTELADEIFSKTTSF